MLIVRYDEWMKALVVLESEKDILSAIKTDDIIDNFAHMSDRLAKQLLLVESVILFDWFIHIDSNHRQH